MVNHVCTSAPSRWEHATETIMAWTPYVTLAISALLTAVLTPQTWTERVLTYGLAVAALAWVWVFYTLAPKERWERLGVAAAYFVGLLVLAALLTVLSTFFFVFSVTGFMHATLLRRPVPVFAGVAATSFVVNIVTAGFPRFTTETVSLYGTIMVIQTAAIGFGTLGGEKLSQLAEQRRQTVAQLEAALEENAGLHAQLLAQAREAGVLDERQRMAREIHDTLAQGLTGIITQLEAAEHAWQLDGEWQRHLDNAVRLARESLSEARRSVQAVRPAPLEEARLPEALAGVGRRWQQLNDVPVEVTVTGQARSLRPEVEVTLLRTAQEALANVAKHARAGRAGVTLSYMDDVAMLDVRDDGVGFDLARVNGSGVGLTAMRQRIRRLDGTLEVESEPDQGTAVSARVPAIPPSAEADAAGTRERSGGGLSGGAGEEGVVA